jgi:hypothetical protein
VTPLRFNEASKGIEPAPAAGRVILCWWRGIQGCGLGIDSKPAALITDVKIKKPAGWRAFLFVKWMGWQDSNLRMTESKSVVLPLDDTPSSENEA